MDSQFDEITRDLPTNYEESVLEDQIVDEIISNLPPNYEEQDTSISKNYSIGNKIGEGGFGSVYAAKRISDGVPAAVKIVYKENISRWDTLNGCTIPLEIRLLSSVQHLPRVIKMLDWFEETAAYMIVMNRPRGCIDMFDYISEIGSLSEDQSRCFFKQVTGTVLECEKAGVVHRDIKVENLLVDRENREVFLIDFRCGAFIKNVVDLKSNKVAGTFYKEELARVKNKENVYLVERVIDQR